MRIEYEKPFVEIVDFHALQMVASSGDGDGFDSADAIVGTTEETRPGRPRNREE